MDNINERVARLETHVESIWRETRQLEKRFDKIDETLEQIKLLHSNKTGHDEEKKEQKNFIGRHFYKVLTLLVVIISTGYGLMWEFDQALDKPSYAQQQQILQLQKTIHAQKERK